MGVPAQRAGPVIMEKAWERRPAHLAWLKECLQDVRAAMAKFPLVGPPPATGITYSEICIQDQRADDIMLDMAQADLQATPPDICSDTSEALDSEVEDQHCRRGDENPVPRRQGGQSVLGQTESSYLA
jgi:uncharacterized protein YciI